MQFNYRNLTLGRNLVLSGNNVYGVNNAVASPGSTQIVTGGIISGGTFVFA
jgi:hypothetical protein